MINSTVEAIESKFCVFFRYCGGEGTPVKLEHRIAPYVNANDAGLQCTRNHSGQQFPPTEEMNAKAYGAKTVISQIGAVFTVARQCEAFADFLQD